jgi:Fe-Mn family superoxide dismutase
MKHKLPLLPYLKNVLASHISSETVEYHDEKHHRAYVAKLNEPIPKQSSRL